MDAESAAGEAADPAGAAAERRAIVIGGAGDPDVTALATTLLAAHERWTVRRVEPPLTRLAVKRALDALTPSLRAAVVILHAPVVASEGGQVLVVGDDRERYPDDATLGLDWVAARVATLRGPAVVALCQALDPPRAVAALAAAAPRALLIAGGGPSTVAIVGAGLGGLASDPTTGTVTLASLGRFVTARLPAAVVRATDDREP